MRAFALQGLKDKPSVDAYFLAARSVMAVPIASGARDMPEDAAGHLHPRRAISTASRGAIFLMIRNFEKRDFRNADAHANCDMHWWVPPEPIG